MTVRARWIQNTYTVRFDANGGAGAMPDQAFTYGFWQDLAPTNVARVGGEFAGWATSRDDAAAYADRASVKNLTTTLDDVVTLYAVWNALLGIADDPGATVTGNDAEGYVIRPSDGKTEIVVTVPAGFDATKITLEVSPDVRTVRANGATLKVVKGGHDITGYLKGLAPDASGRINLAVAEVKEEIVKDALDTTRKENPAEITLDAENPSIRTAPTKPGLTYTFSEGTSLDGMSQKSRKLGDGAAWSPTITVRGGASGFYSIGVTK